MASSIFKLATANTTNLTKIKAERSNVTGMCLLNTTAAAIYLKLYWYLPTAAAPIPVVGTTVPDVTILIPALGTTTGMVTESWYPGITDPGELWIAVTNLPADSDSTAVAAGAGLISLFYE